MKLIHRAILAVITLAFLPATAEEKLILHHFLSPKASAHAAFMEPWARRVEQASGDKLRIELYPSMTLGGKPPELYRQLRDGTADIVWTVIGYTPGVFPRTEVFELPSVHRGDAKATNLAIQEMADMLAEDFADVHPILVHVHAGNALHLAEKTVRNVESVGGMKLRTPSRTGAWMIEAWGAEPVGMPLPSLPQALAKGAVEGALIPFEVLRPLKLNELTDYSVTGPKDLRFGTSVFLFAMNKERYESLSPDLRAVIDEHSGAAIADEIGDLWNQVENDGKQSQLESGGEIIELTPAEKARFDKRAQQVEKRWIEEADANGLDGQALVKTAADAVAKHGE